MSTGLNRLRRIHTFCVNQLVYPLVLSSLLAGVLFAGQFYLTRNGAYRFLLWNLFLAWIPYVCSVVIAYVHQRMPQRGWLILIPALVWFVFLPNAPYLVTDLGHLGERKGVPFWYDIGMLATFAWTGLFLGVASLNTMQAIVRRYYGSVLSWLFALGTLGASALGIYLGRVLDWNSWDLLLNPQHIIVDVVEQFAHPLRNPGAFGFTFLFSAFLLVCYLMFASVEHRQTQRVKN